MTSDKDIIIISCRIEDNVVAELKTIGRVDPEIKAAIALVVKEIKESEQDIEIFEIGGCYIITEKSIIIACYEDELILYPENKNDAQQST
jgi:hypothetical protein